MEWFMKLLTKIFSTNGNVKKDTCAAVQKANDARHTSLESYIEGAEGRAKERFTDLKRDMQFGFTEVKQLLRDKL